VEQRKRKRQRGERGNSREKREGGRGGGRPRAPGDAGNTIIDDNSRPLAVDEELHCHRFSEVSSLLKLLRKMAILFFFIDDFLVKSLTATDSQKSARF